MNTKIFLIASMFLTTLFFIACDKKEDSIPKPFVEITELGYENSKIGYSGTDLHIEAEVVAEGVIDKIIIEIHHEGEHSKSYTKSADDEEWEVEIVYSKFEGKKNTSFHEHIEIPITAEVGHYHFHITVTDKEGKETSVEDELEIKLPEDNIVPEINITSAPEENQTFNDGETISIAGIATDNLALGGLYIGLVRKNQNLTDAEVNASNTITMLHTHTFDSPKSHSFSANITIGAALDNNITPNEIVGNIAWQSGDYYILVKCKDAFGGTFVFSRLYPIVINL